MWLSRDALVPPRRANGSTGVRVARIDRPRRGEPRRLSLQTGGNANSTGRPVPDNPSNPLSSEGAMRPVSMLRGRVGVGFARATARAGRTTCALDDVGAACGESHQARGIAGEFRAHCTVADGPLQREQLRFHRPLGGWPRDTNDRRVLTIGVLCKSPHWSAFVLGLTRLDRTLAGICSQSTDVRARVDARSGSRCRGRVGVRTW